MRILQHRSYHLNLHNGDFLPMGHGRVPGMHQSEIIYAKRQKKKQNPDGSDPAVWAQLGFLFERAQGLIYNGVPWSVAFELTWKEYLATTEQGPEERELTIQLPLMCDNVQMTPDAYDARGNRFESYKLTWRSMRKWVGENPLDLESMMEKILEEFWDWVEAEGGYIRCWNTGAEEIGLKKTYVVRFYVFWVNGDYSRKPGHGPQMTLTDIEYEQGDLDAIWESNLTYRDYLLKEKEKKDASRLSADGSGATVARAA